VAEDPVQRPPIMDFTTETCRYHEWDNIACVHRAQGLATTWSFGNGELQLLHEPEMGAAATCLTLTACGNFVLVGYRSDHADRCLTPLGRSVLS
jgi:U3 small nucleolar RNA-associated protein 21